MNLASIIDDHEADSIALIHRGRPTTYGQLRDQVDRLRGGLASLGVRDGDRMGLRVHSPCPTVFEGLAVRVGEGIKLEVHVDTDEGNAADLEHAEKVELFKA